MSANSFAIRWRAEWLLTGIAAFSFWSTAAVEICAVALLALFLLARPRGLPPANRLVQVVLWALYLTGVVISIFLSQYPDQSYGYLNKLWHATLFLVAVKYPWTEKKMTVPGWAFTISAAAAAGASLIRSTIAGMTFA